MKSFKPTAFFERGALFKVRWPDLLVILILMSALFTVASVGRGMFESLSHARTDTLDMNPALVPYYALRSTLRMFIAYGFSLGFTLIVGYIAAKSARARVFILPALDILQSVPVLGFLSITVTGFMSLFPGSVLGVECASIFAIFTGQVWNMALGFYHSLVTVPQEFVEVSRAYRLNPWQRFWRLELPSSTIGLVWNSMVSFGGGWFFVVQSEAISVANHSVKLPGLGSYMGQAIENGDKPHALLAVFAMITVIVGLDQLVWRPVVTWAEKFKAELVSEDGAPNSWILDFLKRAEFVQDLVAGTRALVSSANRRATKILARRSSPASRETSERKIWIMRLLKAAVFLAVLFVFTRLVLDLVNVELPSIERLGLGTILHMAGLACFTLGRVAAIVVISTLIWTPIGVWIGMRPKWTRRAQPLVQIAASFPVNMTYPVFVGLLVASHVSLGWGSIALMALGTQWYVLFNVIAGASAIPGDLKEAAKVFELRGMKLWTSLYIPAIFPYWVTGACTAAGGAWNASIVAEVAQWGPTRLVARGLGAYIAEVTATGDIPRIVMSIVIMSAFVVILNRFVWRRLYDLAETRFKLG